MQYEIRVRGENIIEKPLDDTKTYGVLIDRADISEIKKRPTGDEEEFKFIYVLENTGDIQLIENGKTIKGKNKSASKSMRGAIYFLRNEVAQNEDDEVFYQNFMRKMIKYLPEIYEFIKNK